MSAFTEKRSDVQTEHARLSREIHEQLAAAGKSLIESGVLPAEEPYRALLAREQDAAQQIDELTRTRDRIVEIGERTGSIEEQQQKLQKRRKEIGAELDPHYQTIGEQAYRVFRNNPLIDQEYADIFTPVLDAHEELRQLRGDLERAESEIAEKPFLEKMVLRGRIIVLRNRLSAKESQLERLYRDAGRQISATDFITTIGDPELDEAAAPFLDLMDEARRLDEESSALTDEAGRLEEELDSLGVERRPATRLSEISEAMQRAQSELDEIRAAIATAAKGSELVEQADAETKELLHRLEETEEAKQACEEKLERLDAAIRAERVAGDIDQLDASIARKQSQIEALTRDINELETRKDELQGQLHEAEEKRGPVEDILR